MKRLLLLLVLGTVGFLALAMAQEWDVFARALRGTPPPRPAVTPENAARAEAAVRELLALLRHLHASGGDPRFTERMPASESLRAEIQADADYVRANGLRQDMTLVRLEVVDVQTAGTGRFEVLTREYWQVEYESISGAPAGEPGTAQVSGARYLVAREGGRFVAVDWAPADAPESEAP